MGSKILRYNFKGKSFTINFLIPGRLVAVKYLTLKRYHQRFPVAMEATERINPSGTSPSSLVVFDPATGDEDVNDSDLEL